MTSTNLDTADSAALTGSGTPTDDAPAPVEVPRKPRASRRIPKSDAVLEAAVERARSGVLEIAPEAQVGRHVSATIEGERLVTHRFEAFVPGYGGWQWYASVARIARSKDVTVCEVGLLPSATALLAPEWLPWSERVRPEDSQPDEADADKPGDVPAEPVPDVPQNPSDDTQEREPQAPAEASDASDEAVDQPDALDQPDAE